MTALLPVWGTLADSVSVAWLPIGVATITAGIFDHFLQRTTGLTKGNLSSHLTKLEEAGLVEIEKRPSARSPTPTSP